MARNIQVVSVYFAVLVLTRRGTFTARIQVVKDGTTHNLEDFSIQGQVPWGEKPDEAISLAVRKAVEEAGNTQGVMYIPKDDPWKVSEDQLLA